MELHVFLINLLRWLAVKKNWQRFLEQMKGILLLLEDIHPADSCRLISEFFFYLRCGSQKEKRFIIVISMILQ